jgi:hypothetical protein
MGVGMSEIFIGLAIGIFIGQLIWAVGSWLFDWWWN